MPITYTVDYDRARVYATVTGEVGAGDAADTIRRIAADPDLRPVFTILSDHREVTRPITQDRLNRVVGVLDDLSHRFCSVRWAIVAPRPASYGMMRVLAARAALVLGMQVQVFLSVEDAEAWLNSAS